MDDFQSLESEWLKPFMAVRSYLKITGINIFDEKGVLQLLKMKYVYFVLQVIVTIEICRFLGEAISEGVDLIDVATDISYLLITLESGCLLYLHFFYSIKKIKTFVSRLGKEWRDAGSLSPDLVTLGRNELKYFTRFNYVYLAGITVFVHSYMLIPATCIIIKKMILKEDVVYVLPFRLILPFEYEDNLLLFLTVSGFLFIMTLNLSYVINGGMLLLTSCISQLRVLFDILQREFREIFNSIEDFNMESRIKRTIQKHTRLLNFSSSGDLIRIFHAPRLIELTRELSDAFGAIFALHLCLLSAVICFFGVTAMINRNLDDLKNLVASLISSATIYHCCYQGQLLTDSAVDVGRATYDSEWYSLSCEHKKIVLIIILRSQQITYIQSTGFTYISLTTFVKIMNMAWSFISVINGMYG